MKAVNEKLGTGLLGYAGILFNTAKQAWRRSENAGKDCLAHVPDDPIIAIVFSAFACEAFINELGSMTESHVSASHEASGLSIPEQVQNLACLYEQFEKQRCSVQSKFHLARIALKGRAYDTGSSPFQEFALLIDLRNALAHAKYNTFVVSDVNKVQMTVPPVIKKLSSHHIASENKANSVTGWLQSVSTPAAAKWACQTAVDIVNDLFACIPESSLQKQVHFFYFQAHPWTFVLTENDPPIDAQAP